MSRILSICVFLLLMGQAGCSMRGVSQEAVEAKGAEFNELTRSRIVSVVDEPYAGARPVPLTKSDDFSSGVFARQITLNKQGGLEDLCATVTGLTGLLISVDSSAEDRTRTSSEMDVRLAAAMGTSGQAAVAAAEARNRPRGGSRIAYEGTVKGLLDLLGSRFGLAWEYSASEGVVFSHTAVRTFTIWGAPGTVTFSNNITNQSDNQQGGSTGAGVAGGSTQLANIKTAQTNTTDLNFDIWRDVEAGVKNLLSPVGTVMTNQAAGTVTVKDTGVSLRRIEKFIDETNERLSRQIALSIKVWALELSDSSGAGINLQMFFENPNVRVFAGSAGTMPVNFQEAGGEMSAAIVDGKLKDSTALLKALRSVGRATQVTSGGGVVMSGQPVPVQAVKREVYLASSSVSTTEYGQTSQLTPGEVTTGFAMTVIPNIQEGRRVVLQYAIDYSSLDDLTEFSSGDSTVQQPKVSSRSFSNRMTLKMGQTLVLAGFEQEISGKNTSGGFLGIGQSRSYKKSLIVITISTESGDV